MVAAEKLVPWTARLTDTRLATAALCAGQPASTAVGGVAANVEASAAAGDAAGLAAEAARASQTVRDAIGRCGANPSTSAAMSLVLRRIHTRAVAIQQAFAAGDRAAALPAYGVGAALRAAGSAILRIGRGVDARISAARETRSAADVTDTGDTSGGAVDRRGTREIAVTAVGDVASKIQTTSPAEREPRVAGQGALAFAHGRGVRSVVTRGTAPAAMHRVARYVHARAIAVRSARGTIRNATTLQAREPLGAGMAAATAVRGARSRVHTCVAAACVTLVAGQATHAVGAERLAVRGHVTRRSAGPAVVRGRAQVHTHRATQRKAFGALDLTHTVGANAAASRWRRACVAARATVEDSGTELDAGAAAVRKSRATSVGTHAIRANFGRTADVSTTSAMVLVDVRIDANPVAAHELRRAGAGANAVLTSSDAVGWSRTAHATATAMIGIVPELHTLRATRRELVLAREAAAGADAEGNAAGRSSAGSAAAAAVIGVPRDHHAVVPARGFVRTASRLLFARAAGSAQSRRALPSIAFRCATALARRPCVAAFSACARGALAVRIRPESVRASGREHGGEQKPASHVVFSGAPFQRT